MNNLTRILIIAAVATAVVAVLIAKQNRTAAPPPSVTTSDADANELDNRTSDVNTTTTQNSQEPPAPTVLPTLLDLGAGHCVPCKMMAPILDQLKEEYQGRMNVVFIDVHKNPAPAKQHKIDLIPTQIFLDQTGKELFRHVGFYSREQILGKWKELGFEFEQIK